MNLRWRSWILSIPVLVTTLPERLIRNAESLGLTPDLLYQNLYLNKTPRWTVGHWHLWGALLTGCSGFSWPPGGFGRQSLKTRLLELSPGERKKHWESAGGGCGSQWILLVPFQKALLSHLLTFVWRRDKKRMCSHIDLRLHKWTL